jgi:hypothetical protein
MKNNRFIFTNFLFFFIFLFIGRFLYPLGDEPDFFLKASKVINNVDHYNGPLNKNTDIYKYFRFFLKSLSENIECNIKSSPLSLFSKIDYKTCIDSASNILARFFITSGYLLLIVIPIFLKKSFYIFKKIGMKCSLHEWNLRKRVFSLSLILPSIVYYAGVLSSEQVTLFLSLLIFLFYGSSNFVAIIIFLILLIDIGSGLMVMCYYFFISIIVNFYKYFFYLIFFFILSLSLIIFFRKPLFNLISYYVPFIGDIFFHADNWMSSLGVVEKYPLILRPIITYMSFKYGKICIDTRFKNPESNSNSGFGLELIYISQHQAERIWIGSNNQINIPAYFSLYSNSLYLWPRPNMTYLLQVRGYRQPNLSWLSDANQNNPNSTAYVDLDNELQACLIAYTMSRIYQFQEDAEMSQVYREQFVTNLKNYQDYLTAPSSNQPIIYSGGLQLSGSRYGLGPGIRVSPGAGNGPAYGTAW